MVGNIAHSQSKHSLQIETSQPSKLTWNAPSVHLSVQLCLSLLSFFSLPLSPVPPSLLTLIFSPRSSFVYRFWIPFCAHPSFMLIVIDPHQLFQTSHCLQWPDINKTLFRLTEACHSAFYDSQMNPPPKWKCSSPGNGLFPLYEELSFILHQLSTTWNASSPVVVKSLRQMQWEY